MATEHKFLTNASFQLKIEEIVKEQEIDYLDATTQFCEDNDISYQDLAKLLVGTNLKEKIHMSAIQHGLMSPISTLTDM